MGKYRRTTQRVTNVPHGGRDSASTRLPLLTARPRLSFFLRSRGRFICPRCRGDFADACAGIETCCNPPGVRTEARTEVKVTHPAPTVARPCCEPARIWGQHRTSPARGSRRTTLSQHASAGSNPADLADPAVAPGSTPLTSDPPPSPEKKKKTANSWMSFSTRNRVEIPRLSCTQKYNTSCPPRFHSWTHTRVDRINWMLRERGFPIAGDLALQHACPKALSPSQDTLLFHRYF